MSNGICEECGYPIAACNEIAILKRALREIRREAYGTRYKREPIEACAEIARLVDEALLGPDVVESTPHTAP